MTRVQELGRLCRYPAVSQTDTVQLPTTCPEGSGSLSEQLAVAFGFAMGADQPVELDLQNCLWTALSMSAAAQNVYAYLSWMSSTNQAKKPNGDHMANLQRLLEELATMVCDCLKS